MEFTLEEIIKATGAKILKNDGVDDLKFTFSTDTRTIKKGEIYLPLKGENFNGEDFIGSALEMGATGYFCSAKCKVQSAKSKLILQVKNTLTSYLELARFYKRKINPKTIAITGSSGKTTTKEMAFCVASQKFKTHKSELNFNNEIGLCKTILSMPIGTEILILEMGMRGLGEIELLSKYSEPEIAIIANVGTAHIGRLGSRENIAKAKCEIVNYLKDNGILIAHDDELIKMQRYKDAKMQSYTTLVEERNLEMCHCEEGQSPDVAIQDSFCQIFFSLNYTKIIERQIGYTKFEYKNHEYELNIEGDYNVQNSLAAIEMGLQLGMNEAEIAAGLKKYSPIEKRWEIQEIKGYKIINDSYNANPESMKAAIETALSLYEPPLLLILGDMGELGDKEVEYHQEIGDFLVKKLRKNIAVITIGKLANEISKKLIQNGFNSQNFNDSLQTSRYILDNVKIGTTIILKASRSMKFEQILENLKTA